MPPERFDHFMARANAAYYARNNPFADFVTAPELTQVFGELLGGWARVAWQIIGAPEDIILVEAGPGSGVLMADALRVWSAGATPPPDVHFIEFSPRLRERQTHHVPRATWHDRLETLPDRPMILLANEFLDALPVRQFVRRRTGWVERFVEDGAYVECPAPDFPGPDDPVGSVREICAAAQNFAREIARRRAVALMIDYGPTAGGPGESVQAIRDAAPADPLGGPGSADITAHVDFSTLAAVAREAGADVQGPVKQNAFLTTLGLFQRSDALAQRNPKMAEKLHLAARRLTAPEAMGSLFKAMAICPPGLPPLPGFEP